LRDTSGAKDLLLNIDGGIYREVSISWRYKGGRCSICDKEIQTCGHALGKEYNGKICYFWIDNVLDVLEGSIVYRAADEGACLAGDRIIEPSNNRNTSQIIPTLQGAYILCNKIISRKALEYFKSQGLMAIVSVGKDKYHNKTYLDSRVIKENTLLAFLEKENPSIESLSGCIGLPKQSCIDTNQRIHSPVGDFYLVKEQK